jgi:hypothetical protein
VSCKRKLPVSTLRARKHLTRYIELLFAACLLSGVLYATPIMGSGASHEGYGKQLGNYVTLVQNGKSTLKLNQVSSSGRSELAVANAVHIPESGALALLGMCLLSIASLLRRRFTR